MARNFQTPLRPERPNWRRRDSKLRAGPMMRLGKGVDEVDVDVLPTRRKLEQLTPHSREDYDCPT